MSFETRVFTAGKFQSFTRLEIQRAADKREASGIVPATYKTSVAQFKASIK